MNEETNPTAKKVEDNEVELKELTEHIPLPKRRIVADSLLQLLVELANVNNLFSAITIHVKGLVISGVLVSRDLYMQKTSEAIRGMNESLPDDFKVYLETQILEPMMKARVADDYTFEDLQYIHLIDAKIFNNGPITIPTSDKGVLWRGRIENVDGFHLGQISMSATKS